MFHTANSRLAEEIKYGGLVFTLSNALVGDIYVHTVQDIATKNVEYFVNNAVNKNQWERICCVVSHQEG